MIHVNEGGAFDAIASLPANREGGIVFLNMDLYGIPIMGELCGELIGRIRQRVSCSALTFTLRFRVAVEFADGEVATPDAAEKLAAALDKLGVGSI